MTTTKANEARELQELRDRSHAGGRTLYSRVYELGPGKTPADVSLDEGNAMPDVTSSEILSAAFIEEKVRGRDGQTILIPSRRLKVVADVIDEWSD